ncbi:MAG: type II toxin-antitoxin system RelE/ParE family toxin [bacterium]
MEIQYRTRQLARLAESPAEARRKLGPSLAKEFLERLRVIQAAPSPDALQRMPALYFHALKGPLAGLFALKLGFRSRLLLSFHIEPNREIIAVVEELSRDHYQD